MGSLEQLALFPGAEEGEEKAPGIARVLLLLNCLYFIHCYKMDETGHLGHVYSLAWC